MDPLRNPYTPGAGTPPPALSGRESQLDQYRLLLGRLSNRRPEQSLLITGLRGVGKTVLLDTFEQIALDRRWFASFTEITSGSQLARIMATMSREAVLDLSRSERVKDRGRRALGALKAFAVAAPGGVEVRIDVDATPGVADSGDLGRDLGDLLIELGETASAAERGVVFLLDEAQFLTKREFEALIAGMHRASRKQLPVTVVGAGLPLLPRLAGEAKSYAERLFVFPRIGALPPPAARDALAGPAREEEVEFADDALKRIIELSEGYPYFLQQYGKHAWLVATFPRVTRDDVEQAHRRVLEILDSDFFGVRLARTTEVERRYLRAMAELGDGAVPSGDVSRHAGYESTSETGPTRDALIKKGLLYSPEWGQLAFTVPMFAAYLRRQLPARVEE